MKIDGNYIFVWCFEAVVLFMAVFFLVTYIVLRKKDYLLYVLYLLSFLFYYPLSLPEYFFPSYTDNQAVMWWINLFKKPLQAMVSVLWCLFVIEYLSLKEKSPGIYKLFKAVLWINAGIAAAYFILNVASIDYSNIYFFLNILLFPVNLYLLFLLFRIRVPYSAFVIWGAIILTLGAVVSLIFSMRYQSMSVEMAQAFNPMMPVQITVLIDIILYSIALQSKVAGNERKLTHQIYLRQKSILKERNRIIADLHDDVGGGLSSIRMMSDLLVPKLEQYTEIQSYVKKISSTTKDIAQQMNAIIWSLNMENDTLENFVEYSKQFCSAYFDKSPIEFSCNLNNVLDQPIKLSGELRKNLFLIIKESLHNVLKHSQASQVVATMNIVDKKLKIDIEDNGIGMLQGNRWGNGLRNMKKRMEAVGGTLVIETAEPGTRISLVTGILIID